MNKNTYKKISQNKGQIAILIDPENSFKEDSLITLLNKIEKAKVDFIFIGGSTVSKKEFETSIFTGEYITPLGENYLQDLEVSRQDEVKAQREKAKA